MNLSIKEKKLNIYSKIISYYYDKAKSVGNR